MSSLGSTSSETTSHKGEEGNITCRFKSDKEYIRLKEKDLKKAEYWVNRVKTRFVPKIDPEKMVEMQLKLEGMETEATFPSNVTKYSRTPKR